MVKIRMIIVGVCSLIVCLSILFVFYIFGIMDSPIKVFEGVLFSLLFPGVIILISSFVRICQGRNIEDMKEWRERK
ncbi:hypothetical protein SAMN02910451_01545 [Butyrivibrio hungatei]|uniref:Uncharacterized protein n=1 Tax=Butyrivibrio hungatei TaxID=185008 RepID=A0A1G5DJ90_9FIRM|nr:hypothetical protein SAMN02910451_01545 [Butyrivibrio hungatei]